MEDHVKALTKLKVKNIHSSPLIHSVSHIIVEGSWVNQAQFALSKSMLAIPNHLPVFHVLANGFHDDLLHKLTEVWCEAGWPVVPQIPPPAFLDVYLVQSSGTLPCSRDLPKIIESDLTKTYITVWSSDVSFLVP